MWFVFALASVLLWGAADLFYKLGADPADGTSHLKTSIAVGLVMGVHAIAVLLFKDISYDPINLLIYLPVSLMYILSMTIGYLGLRYLELSISSPVQNTSGALVSIMCIVFLGQRLDLISSIGVAVICVGVLLLGIFESREARKTPGASSVSGWKAFMLPLIYCVFDALGTFFDAYYLDDPSATPLRGITSDTIENVANVTYELTFFIVAVLLFLYIRIIKKEKLRISGQKNRLFAALFETAGQFAYVFAMSGNGAVAAPMIASYSIVSVVLSAIFLKEKLEKKQYVAIAAVMLGIILLGIAEGLSE